MLPGERLGLALAYLGQKEQAIKVGERAVALDPASRDGYAGASIQHQLARIYIVAGEPDKAIDQLETLLKLPYYLSPAWLRIDPNFAPIGVATEVIPRPQQVVGGLQFAQVSVGGLHVCGKTKSGATYCWGHNRFGNLGDGTTDYRYSPTPVVGSP